MRYLVGDIRVGHYEAEDDIPLVFKVIQKHGEIEVKSNRKPTPAEIVDIINYLTKWGRDPANVKYKHPIENDELW